MATLGAFLKKTFVDMQGTQARWAKRFVKESFCTSVLCLLIR